MAVRMPATARERLLTAPWIDPSSLALAVPMTWAEVPKATPWEMGFFNFSSLHNIGPITLPKMPVKAMTREVRASMPPFCLERASPMATVTLLGSREMVVCLSKENSAHSANTETKVQRAVYYMKPFLCVQCQLYVYPGL